VTKTKLIVNLTRGEALCVGELADRPLRRMRGLLGKRGLPAGEGLLLSPAPAIHTAFMRFPIDALFLDRDLRVLHIVEQLPPWRMASKSRAHAVLELCAGESARCKVEVGDRLELRERKPVTETSTSGSDGAAHHAPGLNGAKAASGPGLSGGPHDSWTSPPARLAPLRVLVISPDHHFRTVIALLLSRRNCLVTTTANGSRLAKLIDRDDIDVVVIDAGEAPTGTTAAHVADIRALERAVGTVVVDERAREPLHGQPVLAKWGPFADLAAAVERAAGADMGSQR